MTADVEFARALIRSARQLFDGQVKRIALDEALFAAGGWRSGLGVLKHLGAWLHVYRSYAFDLEPRHWAQTSWPRGLRDEIELSQEYLADVVAWIEQGFDAWDVSLAAEVGSLGEPRPVHWGGSMPLSDIVVLAMQHASFHLGEFNMLLSIKRSEAWEWTEEVEENHIDTYGHGTRAEWMSPAMGEAFEQKQRLAHEARSRP